VTRIVIALNPVGAAVPGGSALADDAAPAEVPDAVPALAAAVTVVDDADPPPDEHPVANNTTTAQISGSNRTIAR
jgi:hypothetical protein